jgi:hypothetical protein
LSSHFSLRLRQLAQAEATCRRFWRVIAGEALFSALRTAVEGAGINGGSFFSMRATDQCNRPWLQESLSCS